MKTQDSNPNRVTLSCQELAYCNTLVLESLVELLSEKGLVGWNEVQERVQKHKHESEVRLTAS